MSTLAAKAVGGGAARPGNATFAGHGVLAGRVAGVLEERARALEAMPPPAEGREAKPTDPYEVTRLAIGYLAQQRAADGITHGIADGVADRRPGGIAIAAVQPSYQRDREVLEPSQAETILQLRAAYAVAEDDRLPKHLKNRRQPLPPSTKATKRRKAG